METVPLKLVTIVAEALLESQLVQDLKRLGARGYTITEARGEGTGGVHASEWEGRHVKLESLVGPDVADRLLTHLADEYFPQFSVIAYVQDVAVVRGAKYLPERAPRSEP